MESSPGFRVEAAIKAFAGPDTRSCLPFSHLACSLWRSRSPGARTPLNGCSKTAAGQVEIEHDHIVLHCFFFGSSE